MSSDRKKLYIISSVILAALLITLFIPNGSGRIFAALILLPSAIIVSLLIKKRIAKSINTSQIILIMAVSGIVYLVLYYLSAFAFGFVRTGYGFKADILFRLGIPSVVMIVSTEIIRHVLCTQESKLSPVIAYFIGLVGDVVICATIPAITNVSTFMDVVGLTLFPGLLYNLLYNYLTKRYGYTPCMAYRLLTVGIFYFIPYGSGISDSMVAFVNLVIPILLYIFIDSLYEKKKRYALAVLSPVRRAVMWIVTAVVIIFMSATVMLISNQFSHGALVVATTSMTGEIDQGDVAIFEEYDDQIIPEGQVIVFSRDGRNIVHRVVKIETINGIVRYYTKGDANEDMDAGYVLASDIVGLVEYRVPYIGFPTIWLRSLFK